MRLKYLFYFQAVFALMPGLGFIFAPAAMWSFWGTPSESAVMDLAGRNTGTLLLFVSLVAFFSAHTDDSPLRPNICLAYFVLHAVGFIVYFLPLLRGGPTFGPAWIFSLLLALAFGFFRFIKPNG